MKTVNQSKSAQYILLYLQAEVHRVEKENTTRSTTESVSNASGGKVDIPRYFTFRKICICVVIDITFCYKE